MSDIMDEQHIKEIIKREIDSALAVHVYEHHKRRSSGAFCPPSRDEVRAYAVDKRLALNIDKYFGHYESNGWKVGRNTMKDWRAAARNAAAEWARDVNAPWLHEPKKLVRTGPVNVLPYAERVKLREQMQGVGKPVPKAMTVASREDLDRMYSEPVPDDAGPRMFDLDDPELNARAEDD